MSALKAAFLATLAGLLLAFLPAAAVAGSHLQPEDRGLFGTITTLTGGQSRSAAGGTGITLDTKSGPVEFTATTATRVRIPGFDSASVDNLRTGDSVAVLLSEGRAVSILVRTGLPVRTRHFTGVVTSVDEDGSIILRSREGRQINTLALGDLREIKTGELVTAVIEQDPAGSGLAVTGLDRGSASLARIGSALELSEMSKASSNIQALQQRLISNATHHLTTLQEVSQKTEPALARRVREELEAAKQAYADAFSRSGAGKPRAEVAGIVTSIDGPGQRIIIDPQGVDEVEIAITDRTSLWRAPAGLFNSIQENWLKEVSNTPAYVRRFGGREIRFHQLDVASRVRVWYDLETSSANRVLVLPGESLPSGPAYVLLSLALQGEAQGKVTGVNLDFMPSVVTIQDQVSGLDLDLSVAPDSIITRDTVSTGLSSLLDASVAASYEPDSRSIIELDELTPADAEATVHGVVHSFIPKVLPGNFLIRTVEGELQVFNHTENTVIRRDGIRVSISEVRLGDLVRPATHYRSEGGAAASGSDAGQDLVVLSLKSPAPAPVRGTIRGIIDTPGGGALITLSNKWLELVSILVTDNTLLTLENESVGILDLAVGQRVVIGSYNPISSEADRLALAAPGSAAK